MKIIELLNKIANGEEVPKKIKYDNQVFEYREDMLDYYCYDYDLNLMGYQKILNDEVEIIEEEKKIPEKLDIYVEDDEKWIQTYNYDTIPLDIKALSHEELVIIKTLNQIIDYLKIKGE